jgi:hypothetical protein
MCVSGSCGRSRVMRGGPRRNEPPNGFRPWDALPDGKGFLSMALPATLNSNLPNEMVVVLNWRRELEQLLRAAR